LTKIPPEISQLLTIAVLLTLERLIASIRLGRGRRHREQTDRRGQLGVTLVRYFA
jgi:small basic protein